MLEELNHTGHRKFSALRGVGVQQLRRHEVGVLQLSLLRRPGHSDASILLRHWSADYMQVNPMSVTRGDARGGVVGARIYGPGELPLGTVSTYFMCELIIHV
jgi:hypothetical protein